MNTVLLNTVHLDGAPIIKKVSGEGGGSTILNQSKSVEITENGSVSVTPDVGYTGLSKVNVNVDVPTQYISNQDKAIDIVENGTTEIVADSGYTGLGKVSVSVNVASSGGGSVEPPKDGKTRLFITVDQEEKKQVQIVFQQNIANGINIDWGDGSPSETSNEALNSDIVMFHEYVTIGEYVITIDVAPSCNAGIGYISSSSNAFTGNVSISRKLHKVIIGNGININKSAFYSCYALKNVEILNEDIIIGESSFGYCYSLGNITLPNTMSANIVDRAFNVCYSLVNISIPNGIVTITNGLFQNCKNLESVTFPPTIENIESNAFKNCENLKTLDFSRLLSVPTLEQLSFTSASSDFKVIIPDALYDEWIAATNWSAYASNIIKKSDWDASQA